MPSSSDGDPPKTSETDGLTLTGGALPKADGLTLTGGAGAKNTGGMTLTGGADLRAGAGATLTGGLTAKFLQRGAAAQQTEKVMWSPGDVIDGKYEVTGIAGKGGMGVVYKIHHREWNIDMAVKTPLPELVRDPGAKARFVREAQTWVDLGLHPNLVQCWYVRELGGLPRVFADFLAGGSLKDWMVGGKVKPGDWGTILDLAIQACDGLGYAHDLGAVHRDVKPGNMLMSEDGRLCVTDFGLVKLTGVQDIAVSANSPIPTAPAGDSDGLTVAGSMMGTPEYGAPEQWGGSAVVDARADIYALGGSIFEMCCGRRPFDDARHREPAQVIIGRHITSTPPDPRTFRKDLPESFAQAILQTLAKNPADRPASMRALREILAGIYTKLTARPARGIPKVAGARAAGMNNRGVSMWDLGKPQEALAAWREALKLDPQHVESMFNAALVEWREGRITDLDVEQRLNDARRTEPLAALYLASLYLESRSARDAETAFKEALADPQIARDGAAWRGLGHALMAQEKFEEAAGAYADALKRLGTDSSSTVAMEMAERRTRERSGMILFPSPDCIKVPQDRVGSVRAMSLSADGATAIIDGAINAVTRYELPAARLVRNMVGHQRQVTGVALSADARFAVSGSEDGTVKMWNVAGDKAVEDFYGKGHIGAILCLAVTPDFKHAISGGGDKSIRVWELHKGAQVQGIRGHERGVVALTVTHDSKQIVSAAEDGTVKLWQIQGGACLATLKDESGLNVRSLLLSEDSKTLATGGTDGTIRFWDLASQKVVRQFTGHKGPVMALATTPDNRFFLSGGEDHTIRLWDAHTGRCLRTFKGHQGPVQVICVTHDGNYAFSGAAENLGNPLRLWKLELSGFLNSAGMRALANHDCALVVSRAAGQEQSQNASTQFEERLAAAEGALQNKSLMSALSALQEARAVPGYERDPRAMKLNATLSLALPRRGVTAGYLRHAFPSRHVHGVRAIGVNGEGTHAISAGDGDKTALLWSITSLREERPFEGHKQPVEGALLTVVGALSLTASLDGTAVVWDTETGKVVHTLKGHAAEVTAIAVTPDGRIAVTASMDASLRVWQLANGTCMKTLSDGDAKEALVSVMVMADGRTAVSGGRDGTVRLWSLVTGKCLRAMTGHAGGVVGLAAPKDGRFVLSIGEDRTMRMWSPDSGQCLKGMRDIKARFMGLAVSPDGRFAFTGGMEGPQSPVRVWDLNSGAMVSTFGKHPRGIGCLALTADGCLLVSGGEDGAVRVWDVEWELDVTRAADATGKTNVVAKTASPIPAPLPPTPATPTSGGTGTLRPNTTPKTIVPPPHPMSLPPSAPSVPPSSPTTMRPKPPGGKDPFAF